MVQYLSQFNLVALGILASLAAGLATGVGSIPIFFTSKITDKVLDPLLGFAAGVMLAATSFSLILPAIEKGGGGLQGAAITVVGIMAGGYFLDLVDRLFPNTNLMTGSMESPNLRRVWLFVLAITIHNFPEGLAVGVGFGDGDIINGLTLAIGIGLQNLPEGLAVALPLVREGFPTWKAFLIALATGLVEPVGGLIGVGLVHIARPVLPFALSFAAGAMLFVISHEIIPECQKDRGSKLTTHLLMIGFVIMMFLDNTLG